MNWGIEGSMVKKIPENAATRAQSEEDEYRAEKRHFSGSVPRSMEVFASSVGTSVGASRRGSEAADKKGMPLCGGQKTVRKTKGLDFGDSIGRELQSLYDDLVAQPVPDRFVNLLNQLEKNMVSSGRNSAPGERE